MASEGTGRPGPVKGQADLGQRRDRQTWASEGTGRPGPVASEGTDDLGQWLVKGQADLGQ